MQIEARARSCCWKYAIILRYPADVRESTIRTRIPGRGMEVLEVTYQEDH